MTRIAHTTLDAVTGYACVIHAGRHQKATLADIVEKTPVTKTIKAGAPIETKFL